MNFFKRGMLTEATQIFANHFLGRYITVKELRLYPYIDYCAKNSGSWNLSKVTDEEMKILDNLQEEKHIEYGVTYCVITRAFYDYIQTILAETYVPEFLSKAEAENKLKERNNG